MSVLQRQLKMGLRSNVNGCRASFLSHFEANDVLYTLQSVSDVRADTITEDLLYV